MLRGPLPIWLYLPLKVMVSVTAGIFVSELTGHSWIGLIAAVGFIVLDVMFVVDDRRTEQLEQRAKAADGR